MACGRPKNLEIGGGNLLCGSRDRRRNFPTTGNGSRQRGNPEPRQRGKPWSRPGKGSISGHGLRTPGATGKGRFSGLWSEENPEPSGKGRIRGPLVSGGTPSHRRRGNSPPPGTGATPGQPATGVSEPLARKHPGPPGNGISGPLAWGTWSHRRRGTSSLWRGAIRSHPATGHLGPLAWGDPEPPGNGTPRASGLGGPGAIGEGATPRHRQGETS